MTKGKKEPLVTRFWARVKFDYGCMLWTGPLDRTGYGQIKPDGPQGFANLKSHQAAWVVTYGDIPPGMYVCHKCDNRQCVNPAHLFLGTQAENMADAARKGRLARKLKPEDIPIIRASPENARTLAKKYGVAHSLVERIKRREAWAHH